MNIKVGDLGLATKLEFHDERKMTMCGTPNYIAPEILTGGAGHSYEVDIWSTGVICYAMMYGRPPFESSDITKTYEKIKYGLFDFPVALI
jgi:polo-like kinase 1